MEAISSVRADSFTRRQEYVAATEKQANAAIRNIRGVAMIGRRYSDVLTQEDADKIYRALIFEVEGLKKQLMSNIAGSENKNLEFTL
jgi:hypothetical protein